MVTGYTHQSQCGQRKQHKMYTRYILIACIILLSLPAAATSYKVESDIKLFKIELEKTLKNSQYQLKTTTSNTLKIYFDTPELDILKNKGALYYQAQHHKTNNNKYLEKVIYTNNKKTAKEYEVKHYEKVKSIQGKHPLLALIKRKQRAEFSQTLNATGIAHPMTLKYMFDVSQQSRHYQLYKNGIKQAHYTVTTHKINNHKNVTINKFTIDNNNQHLTTLIPQLKLTKLAQNENTYTTLYNELRKKEPNFDWKRNNHYLLNIIYITLTAIIGCLIIFLLNIKRLFK